MSGFLLPALSQHHLLVNKPWPRISNRLAESVSSDNSASAVGSNMSWRVVRRESVVADPATPQSTLQDLLYRGRHTTCQLPQAPEAQPMQLAVQRLSQHKPIGIFWVLLKPSHSVWQARELFPKEERGEGNQIGSDGRLKPPELSAPSLCSTSWSPIQ